MTIFIGIPSYRDPELLPTLQDCIAKARWPDDLRIGLCWQHDAAESLGHFADDRRFRIVDVPFAESRGCCWARSQYASRYEGEDFVLQLDSHHRFIEEWDAVLIDMMARVPSRKAILTTYPPAYNPEGQCEEWPTTMEFVTFTAQGTIIMNHRPMANFADLDSPIPSRFLAGGFSFSVGQFLQDIPPDPQLYFRGEEANMCVRAFTHGYDTFHPHKIICWHRYSRGGQPKHWEDHTAWHELERNGLARFRRLFGIDYRDPSEEFGAYGFGTLRSLRDYERFAGVHFGLQGVEEHTFRHERPPSPLNGLSEADWLRSLLQTYRVDIEVDSHSISKVLGGSASWILSICRDGAVVQERKFSADEMRELRGRRYTTLHVQYLSREAANMWKMSVAADGGEFVGGFGTTHRS